MPQYQLDHRRLRFIEFVRLAYPNTVSASLLWIPLKLGLVNWRPQIIPGPESIATSSISLESLPSRAHSHLQSLLPTIMKHGYVESLFECVGSNTPTGEEITGVAMRSRHNSGSHILQSLISFTPHGAQQTQEILVTFHRDSRTTATTNGRPNLDLIPSASATYHPGKSFHQLVIIHTRKLEGGTDDTVVIRNNDDMVREFDAMSERYFSHMVQRGVMKEIQG